MGVSSGSIRAGAAYVEINLKSNISKQARAVQIELQTMSKSIATLGGALSNVGSKALVGLSATLSSLIFPVSLAAGAESTRVAFETLLKSGTKTKKLLAELRSFAASTPFEFPELADAAKKLIAFGSSSETVTDELRRIGDISSGIGAPIGEIAELYGKARIQGRLFGEDINQLTGRGIPVIQEFAKQFGVAESEVRKLTESGQINFKNLEQAFISLTSKSGQFGGGMAKQAQTLSGLWSTLKDDISAALLPIGEALLPMLKQFVGRASEVAQKVAQWVRENSELIPSYAELVVKITAGAAAVTAFGKGLQFASGLLGSAADLVKLLSRAYETLGNAFSAVGAITTANSAATALNTKAIKSNTVELGKNGTVEFALGAALNTSTGAILAKTSALAAATAATAGYAAASAAAAAANAFEASSLGATTAGYLTQAAAIGANTKALALNSAARTASATKSIVIDAVSFTTNSAAPVAGLLGNTAQATQKSAGIISRIISALGGTVIRAFGSMGTAISSALGPIGLVAAAIAAVGAAYLYVVNRSGLLTDAFKAISKAAQEIGETINKTFGGIIKALSLGEYQRAIKILTTGVKLALLQGLSSAVSAGTYVLHNFVSIFKQFGDGIVQTIYDVFSSIPKIIQAAITGSQSVGEILYDIFSKNTDGLLKRSVDELKADLNRQIAALEKEQKAAPDKKQEQAQQVVPVQAKQQQQVKPELSEGSKAIRERIKALRDEMEVLRYGEEIAQRRKLKQQGASDQEIRVLMIEERRKKQLEQQHEVDVKLTEDAQALKDSLKTPLDEFKQQIQNIDKLYAAGKISEPVARQAKEKAKEQLTADVLPKSPMQEFKKRVEEIRQMVAQRIISPDQGEQAVASERAKITQSVTGVTSAVTGNSAHAANLFRSVLPSNKPELMLSKKQLAVQERQEKILERIEKKEQVRVSRIMLN